MVASAPIPAPSTTTAAAIADEPLKAVDTLRIIIAQKLKKKLDKVPLSKSIKELVNGKSTLQNKILGDLQLEFTSVPERGEELPLEELGSALATGYSGALGKHTSSLISRLVGSKMPGGFNLSTAKSYLSKAWGLGLSRADAVMLLGLTMELTKCLGSEAEAKTWLDQVIQVYAQCNSIALSQGGSASNPNGGGAVINREEFLKFRSEQEQFVGQQMEVYMRYLKRDSRSGDILFDKEKERSATLQSQLDSIIREHGDLYLDGIKPVSKPLKACHFDSSWNWVRQDALLMFYDIIFGCLTTVDWEITARCIAIMNRADPSLLAYMQYYIDNCDPEHGLTYKLAKDFGQCLIDNRREVIGQPPLYRYGKCFYDVVVAIFTVNFVSSMAERFQYRKNNIFNDNSPLILYEMMCTGMSNIDLHMYKDRLMNDGNDNVR